MPGNGKKPAQTASNLAAQTGFLLVTLQLLFYESHLALKLVHSVWLALLALPPPIPMCSAAQRCPSLNTQFTASQLTSRRVSGVLNRFLKESPVFSSKLPQQVSHLSLAV